MKKVKSLKIALQIGDPARKEEPIVISAMLNSHCLTIEKSSSIMKKI